MKLAPLLLLATLLPACSGPSRQTPLPTPPAVTPLAEAEPAPAPNSAAIVAASNLPALLPAPLAGDAMGVTIHRLANGMTVYISTDREQPRISARIAVRAGSRNDPAESTGLAHYLEHMLFKGTGKLATLDIDKERPHLDRIAELYRELRATSAADARARILAELDAATQRSAAFAVPNEFVQLYASLGVTGVNAFTSNDQTVYIATVPSNRFAAWARVEAERFIDPQFRLTSVVDRPADWQVAEKQLEATLAKRPGSSMHAFVLAYLRIFRGRAQEAEPYLKVAEKKAEYAEAVKLLREKALQ